MLRLVSPLDATQFPTEFSVLQATMANTPLHADSLITASEVDDLGTSVQVPVSPVQELKSVGEVPHAVVMSAISASAARLRLYKVDMRQSCQRRAAETTAVLSVQTSPGVLESGSIPP